MDVSGQRFNKDARDRHLVQNDGDAKEGRVPASRNAAKEETAHRHEDENQRSECNVGDGAKPVEYLSENHQPAAEDVLSPLAGEVFGQYFRETRRGARRQAERLIVSLGDDPEP